MPPLRGLCDGLHPLLPKFRPDGGFQNTAPMGAFKPFYFCDGLHPSLPIFRPDGATHLSSLRDSANIFAPIFFKISTPQLVGDGGALRRSPYNICKNTTCCNFCTGTGTLYHHGLFRITVGIKQHNIVFTIQVIKIVFGIDML